MIDKSRPGDRILFLSPECMEDRKTDKRQVGWFDLDERAYPPGLSLLCQDFGV